jgi:hypothetical protein
MKELIVYETWHGVMWLGGEDQDWAWLNGLVASMKGKLKALTWQWSLSKDLAPMDWSNGEEEVSSRSMNQQGCVMIWSGSYHLLIKVGACVASTLEEMKRNAQGKGIFVGHFISPVQGCVEKCMTYFRIDGRTIKRGKFVCISVI